MFKTVRIGSGAFGNHLPLGLFAGPCVLESKDQALEVCGFLVALSQRHNIPFVYKTSFDKANRTSAKGHRGVSIQEALSVFRLLKERFGCPVMTDVHEPSQCEALAEVVDVLQIPALLCRQTDLIVAAAKTGRALNIKKGQFLSAKEMHHVAEKALQYNPNVLLCERGNSFGYHLLVNDMRGLSVLADTGCPVVFDATHSVQHPGALSGKSGGERKYVEILARAAVAAGIAAVFMETHPDPDNALSDGPNMVPLSEIEGLMKTLCALDACTKKHPYSPFSSGTF